MIEIPTIESYSVEEPKEADYHYTLVRQQLFWLGWDF